MQIRSVFLLFFLITFLEAMGQPLPPGGVTMVITEIMYDMPGTADSLEYIELHNPSDTNERTLSLYKLSEAVDFTFPAGLIVPPDGFVLVAKDSVAFFNTFGYEAFQWHSGELDDNGELVVLRNNVNAPVDSVHYLSSAPWPDAAGNGHSIVLCNDTLPNLGYENWGQASNNTGITVDGVPIFANPGTDCNNWVGMEEVVSPEIEVFPNPSSGMINIRVEDPHDEMEVRINDQNGKMIFSEFRSAVSGLIQIELDLAEGIYVLSVTSGKDAIRQRLVILE